MRRGSVVRVPCACALVCDRDLLLACMHEFPCTRVGRWQCVANVFPGIHLHVCVRLSVCACSVSYF